MSKIRIAIDRGGTFTDCIANAGSGNLEDDVVIKLLSVDPKNYPDAPLEGIRRLLEICEKKRIPRGRNLDISGVDTITMGTTLATNCALERTGERCALITTKGFKDALIIGDQTRPNIFDLAIKRPSPLYETVVEVGERVTLADYAQDPKGKRTDPDSANGLVLGKSGETVRILEKIDEEEVRATLNLLYATGIRSLAVAFLHSYTYQEHEKIVYKIAKDIGFTHVSLSSELSPMIKYIPRANSAVADSYLTPVIKSYLEGIECGLDNAAGTRIQFMQSDGGLVDAHKFSGLRAILSGPAGGVVGYSVTCYNPENRIPLIGFDMGGTSTDVSRYGNGMLEHVFETTTAGITIQTPQLDINTVAAGGSSRIFWKNGLFKVGPESATAHPGPACYRKGGPLTITDANLYLGRLVPELFPHIFGPNESEPLDIDASRALFEDITEEINAELGANMTVDEVAFGFLKVANESMARPIRTLTEAKGHVISQHRLVSFGGAGGQHAVSIAETLGIDTVLIHRYSSILSAYGMFLADVVEECREPCSYVLDEDSPETMSLIDEKFNRLLSNCTSALKQQGFTNETIRVELYLNLRYEGTETALMVLQVASQSYAQQFHELHEKEFGFKFEEKAIIVDDVRVRATGISNVREEEHIDAQLQKLETQGVPRPSAANSLFSKPVMFDDGWVETPVFKLNELEIGTTVNGPAIIADGTQTNLLTPNSSAVILKSHIFIKLLNKKKQSSKVSEDKLEALQDNNPVVDPVLLSIFGHRFMDIAEQMGNQLRKTSVSTNVKERLDFSCALFDKDGNLVANAPHVPVHLGSMSTCIKMQAKLWQGKLRPGDSVMTNHPEMGGTHLPDITVITPAFDLQDPRRRILFYVASRAHHADIGGTLPGSMPPFSRELYEEGAAIYSEKLVQDGKFDEAKVVKLFYDEPAKHAGCSGSRKLADNVSDLKAQIAANTKGITLVTELVKEYGFQQIETYMYAIQQNASDTVKKTLNNLSLQMTHDKNDSKAVTQFESHDFMDDGTKICLKITLDPARDKYTFDFTGTSPQVYGNLNAPEAITFSATLYVLRCLVDEEIPLNQGCLDPVDVIIPRGSVLSPRRGAAVVGGNVMTSQRVTDVILKTLKVSADSQGDCNNFTFGNDGFGYYETICGGHGAGRFYWRNGDNDASDATSWHGTSAVHTNMTNTRMTDVEIFERHYPVVLRRFAIRENSGGDGLLRGGDGVIREVQFTEQVQASILSERRVHTPRGLNGGQNGRAGLNLWLRSEKGRDNDNLTVVNLGGKNTVTVLPGDRIVIHTPGGGGYGCALST
ncbi:unnamed protein product [Kluyveromyces dobzhanskii CBS 2104]|uniref:WGS project CCBQ000000000 data, contig 00009 n=1 Tax=Kluyveromyces dobzhanskii CBS 2104 TaxID=1427455 RepID=A0A0A8L2W8_9SACH|nr:unnamed protein product [Kluyveromyces dobzhanskii CBS 2104]